METLHFGQGDNHPHLSKSSAVHTNTWEVEECVSSKVFHIPTVIEIFSSPLLSCTEGLFPFCYADLSSLFDESKAKNIHFSTYTLPIFYTRCVYAGCSTTTRIHRDFYHKIKNEVGFPCHDIRYLILGLPYIGNISTWPFSCILKAIRAQFQAMEKGRKHSTLRARLLWRNYFILSLHPFVPQV
jgi:hypothetical protein